MEEKSRSEQAAYLVMVRDPVVSLDIADSIAHFDPGAPILVRTSVDEALKGIGPHDRLAVAFLEMTDEEFRTSPLAVHVRERRGRAVLISDQGIQPGMPGECAILRRPFSFADLLRCLETPDCRCEARA